MTVITGGHATVTLVFPPAVVFPLALGGKGASVVVTGGAATTVTTDYPNGTRQLGVVRLDRLNRTDRIATAEGMVDFQMQQRWQSSMEAIEQTFAAIGEVVTNNAAFIDGLKQAQAAAASAQAAADKAAQQAQQQADLQRVRDSYSDANVLSASNVAGECTVSVAAHQRHYLDPDVSVTLSGGSVGGLAAGQLYFVYYDDLTLSGGAVEFKVTIDNAKAVASLSNPYRHAVGSIKTPDAAGGGSVGGSGPPPWKLPADI